MGTIQKSELLKQKALRKLEDATKELMKPLEDVVSFSICSNSKLAIKLLLESYLLKNNIQIKNKESIALLLERCVRHNPKFKTIDLSRVDCRYNLNNHNYCSGLEQVANCLDIAKQIESLLNN